MFDEDLGRSCDACGKPLGGGAHYCPKCKISLCMLCAIRLIWLQKKFPQIALCAEKKSVNRLFS